jgi:hypothetical protein
MRQGAEGQDTVEQARADEQRHAVSEGLQRALQAMRDGRLPCTRPGCRAMAVMVRATRTTAMALCARHRDAETRETDRGG